MKAYLRSLGAGVLVGVVYSLLGVRSPALCLGRCRTSRRREPKVAIKIPEIRS